MVTDDCHGFFTVQLNSTYTQTHSNYCDWKKQ